MRNNRKKTKRNVQTNINRNSEKISEQEDSEVENTNMNKSLKRKRKSDDDISKKTKKERKEKKAKTKKKIKEEKQQESEDEDDLSTIEDEKDHNEDNDDNDDQENKYNDENEECETNDDKEEQNETLGKIKEVTWSQVDLTELIIRMENSIPEQDTLAYSTRAEKLNWTEIAFNDYTGDDCKKIWSLLQKRIRKFRLLSEVLSDAKKWISNPKSNVQNLNKPKKHPDMPRRPPSSYILFCMDKRDEIVRDNPGLEAPLVAKLLGQLFRSLSPNERESYEKAAAESRVAYAKNLQEFYELHPECIEEAKKLKESTIKNEKHSKDEKLIKDDKSLKNEKTNTEKPIKIEKTQKNDKTKMIKQDKPIKIEKTIKIEKEKKERPPKRGQTAFGLYFQSELTNKTVDDRNAFKEKCKETWKQLPEKKKLLWILEADEQFQKYKEEVQNYKDKHPDYQLNELKPILTKQERAIKKRSSGEPEKPPNSAYNLYSKTMLQSEEIKAINPKDRMNHIANKWKNLDEDLKKSYRDQYLKLMEKFKLDFNSYLETLPEEERALHVKQKRKERKPAKSIKPQEIKKQEPVVQTKLEEPIQPPISAAKYFASIYKGDGDPIRAWKTLTSDEKRKYEGELTKKKEAYIVEFEKFLKSLTQEELEAFSRSRQQQEKSDESSECSDSDVDDDDDENEDDDNNSNSCESM